MAEKLLSQLNTKKPGSGLYGYRNFINNDKIKMIDEPIDIGDDLADIQSVSAESEIPPIQSPTLTASIRATSPVPSIVSSHRSKMSRSSIVRSGENITVPKISSPTPSVASSHRSRRSRRDPSPTPSSKSSQRREPSPTPSSNRPMPVPEDDPVAERLLKFQLELRREKLYNRAVRLRDKYGVRFTKPIKPDMPIHELENELKLATRNRKIERNVDIAKRGIDFVTRAIEWVATYTPVDLDGWGDEIRRDMSEIGEILEELHEVHEAQLDKIGTPWTKLMLIWLGGGFKVAATNMGPKYMNKALTGRSKRKSKKKEESDSESESEIGDIDPIDPELAALMKEAEAMN